MMKRDLAAAIPMVLAAAYSFLLVPSVLSEAGAPFLGVYFVSVITALVGALLMGALRIPMLLAPSLVVTVFLVEIPILSHGMSWQISLLVALAATLVAFLLSFLRRMEAVLEKLPRSLSAGLGTGIALMLIAYGGITGDLIVRDPVSVITLGDFKTPLTMLSFVGILIFFALRAAGVRAAILISMGTVALISFCEGFWVIPPDPFLLPEGLDRTALQFTLTEGWNALPVGDYVNLFVFLLLYLILWTRGSFAAFFPTGEGEKEKRDIARKSAKKAVRRIYLLGALAAVLGAPPLVAAPETAAGREKGAELSQRGGFLLAALLVPFLFLEPVLYEITTFPACLVPGLVGSGVMLLERVGNPFRMAADFPERASVGILIFLLPVTRDIALSLGAGLMTFVFLKCMAGKRAEVEMPLIVLFLLLLAYFFYGYWSILV